MAVISLLSAKGSPGVTTLCVGLALAWPVARPGRRCVCVDADPAGGDTAAGVLRGAAPATAGMLALATARGVAAQPAVAAAGVPLVADRSVLLLPGVPDAARSGALGLAWDVLCAAHRDAGDSGQPDLIVDAGRVDPSRGLSPWLADSDLVGLVVRPSLPAVVAAHRFAASWRSPGSAGAHVPLGLVVVDAPSGYRAGEVADAVGLDLLGVVPFDPGAARVHCEGAAPRRGFTRSAYARALVKLAADAAGRVHERPAASVVP